MESFDYSRMRREVIDGVIVVHTGIRERVHQGYVKTNEGEGRKDLGYKTEEVVELRDRNGNAFYSNFKTLEEAQECIAKLAERGITAVIGPKAPWRRDDGKFIPNGFETAVGIYIVKQLEKEQGYTDETPNKHR